VIADEQLNDLERPLHLLEHVCADVFPYDVFNIIRYAVFES